MEPQHDADIALSLQAALEERTNTFLCEPFLKACADKLLPLEDFNRAALSRFGGGAPLLENLLLAGIFLSRKEEQPILEATFADNLKDERGVKGHAAFSRAGSHAAWRHDFLLALGCAQPSAYERYVNDLIEKGDLSELTGAVLWLEYSIPEEFKIIQDYLKDKRPDLFSDPYALLYLNHHIGHDAHKHFPDLLQAVQSSKLDFEALKTGISGIAEAKAKAFYRPETASLTQA